MHLDDLLVRPERSGWTEDDRARFESHLASCAECRRLRDTFRRIDATLQEPAPPAAEEILAKVKRRVERTRRNGWILGILGAVQLAGGIALVAWAGSRGSVLMGAVAGIALGDAVLLGGVAWVLRNERERLLDAGRDWKALSQEWSRQLKQDIQGARWGMATSVILLLNGMLQGWRGYTGGGALPLALGVASFIVGLSGLVVWPLRKARAGDQLHAMEDLLRQS